MTRFVIAFILGILSFQAVYADDADRYVREAEYYQKKADGYRREAAYYLKKAEQYERDAAYYTKKGKTDTAKSCQRKAKRAMDNYKTQRRYASCADEKAADYLKRASNALEGQHQTTAHISIVYQ